MCPVAQTDGHDEPWLVDEGVSGTAAVVDQVLLGCEHTVGEPIVAHELPEVLDRVQLGALGWQGHEGDVGRHDEAVRWSRGADGLVSRLVQRLVILFFWPIRASSANQTSIWSRPIPFSSAISSRRAGKVF